jgi:GTPase Era involved in 16S rRNA processing
MENQGQSLQSVVSQLQDLLDRLQSGRFHLAVLGQFKRGKSTLLNALLGEEVLPTAAIPLTAIPTFLKPGPTRRIEVYYQGRNEPETYAAGNSKELMSLLSKYVTEGENPRNRLGVAYVEVNLPAAILEKGVVFIDTPGIGSTFRHNTEATLNFLPQCDAAFFLVSADPPITEVEIEFLQRVREKVPHLFFILNKIDFLDTTDRTAVLRFLEETLREQAGVGSEPKIFSISAKNGFRARKEGLACLWEESGLSAVERHLVEFLANEKHEVLCEAVARKANDLIAEALMRLRLEKQSIEMPIEVLRKRLAEFERGIEQVKNQRRRAGDMLAGDGKRTISFLEEHAGRLRTDARTYLEGVVKEALARAGGSAVNEEALHVALDTAIPGWFEYQTGATADLFRERIAEVLRPHQEEADAIIETIRQQAAELFDIPYRAPEGNRAFEMVQQPYWITRQWSSGLNPLPRGFTDGFLPENLRRRRILKRVNEQIESLVLSNVENLRWATYQSVSETFRRFGAALDKRLEQVLESTHGAIRTVLEERATRGGAVKDRIALLDVSIADLGEIYEELNEVCTSMPARRPQDEMAGPIRKDYHESSHHPT